MPTTTRTSSRSATGWCPDSASPASGAPGARRTITCTSRSAVTAGSTIRSTCYPCRDAWRTWTRQATSPMSSREAEEAVPDEPLESLVDAVDEDVRDETRETSRANLGMYLAEIARIPLLARYVREQRRLTQALGRPPTSEELAQAHGTSEAEIAELEEVRQHPVSLDAPVGADSTATLGDLIADRAAAPSETLTGLFRA